jgi:hypothetical protein
MSASLEPHAREAAEASRVLDRSLTSASTQWNDSTRVSFNQRHAEPLLSSGRSVARELAELARQLDVARRQLHEFR